ncbi:hypothetical protein DMP17_01570 [Pseudonocardia sp. TMWB2A]|uniref:lysozyme inhibitor LprI family protein n=1 Tax=Pseudonocardia sp. TMWB2A TaxID=687430 RepID=UPI00307E96E8
MAYKHAYSIAGIAALMALPLAAIPVQLSAAPAKAKVRAAPTFNCSRAANQSEKLICQYADLAALDRAVGAAYQTALAKLDARARKALQEDQQAFLRLREGVANPDFTHFDPRPARQRMATVLTERRNFLRSIRKPDSRAIVTGEWRNLFGGPVIKAWPPRAFEVDVATADPLSVRWVCEAKGIAANRGGALVLDATPDNTTELRFVREGDMLTISQHYPPDTYSNENCGLNGTMNGHYFYVARKGSKS